MPGTISKEDLAAIVIIGVGAIAYGTGLLMCIKHGLWFLLVFECIAFPVAIAHGVGAWLGVV